MASYGQGRVALDDPERGGDRGRDQQQDDEHILKLRQEPPPGRDRLLGGELVRSVLGEPGARVLVAQPASLIGPERGDQFARVQPVRNTRLWRFARDGRHVVCSLRGGTQRMANLFRGCQCRRLAEGHFEGSRAGATIARALNASGSRSGGHLRAVRPQDIAIMSDPFRLEAPARSTLHELWPLPRYLR